MLVMVLPPRLTRVRPASLSGAGYCQSAPEYECFAARQEYLHKSTAGRSMLPREPLIPTVNLGRHPPALWPKVQKFPLPDAEVAFWVNESLVIHNIMRLNAAVITQYLHLFQRFRIVCIFFIHSTVKGRPQAHTGPRPLTKQWKTMRSRCGYHHQTSMEC
jgi:hypothetical protein